MRQQNQGNGQSTEAFRIVGISSHAEALKKLARPNPDWNLGPDEIVGNGKAGQKIYRLKFVSNPVELRPDSNVVTVIVAGQEIGYIRPEDSAHVKDILNNYDVQRLACGIWGGQYKTVDEFYDVTTQKQGIAATVRIVYIDEMSDFPLNVGISEYSPKKAVKSFKKVKAKKSIFKRWWFWVIIVLVILIAIGNGGESEEKNSPSTAQSETSGFKETIATIPINETNPVAVTIEPTAADDGASAAMKNALKAANSYLNYTAFSYTGLIGQLEYEGYTTEEATYAADNCGADWTEQALRSAKKYLDYTAFSYTGLIGQLEYEGFTPTEATYGADNCGADWFEQAEKCAKNYLDYSAFSRTGLIAQLEYEGFTNEQAVYGVEQNGL